jgi:RHS repeat-associated protein
MSYRINNLNQLTKTVMKKLLLAICILLNFTTLAQLTKKDSLKIDSLRIQLNAAGPSSNNYAPNFSPLTPNAASFQKHGDYQVNLATGVPDISIPLYTIEEGVLKNPIVLRYHAGGHKMTEFAPWVGWGFNLDFGPSLNRSILGGMADDKNSTGGYLYNSITNRDLCNSSSDFTFCSNVNAGNADLEPDLFTYSTPSSGGKFMLRQSGQKPFQMPWQAVNIENEINPDGTIKAFSVANIDGSNYHFGITTGGYGGTEYQRTWNGAGNVTDNGIATWQIGQVTSLTNENEISFQYQTGGTVTQAFQSWGASMTYNDMGSPTSPSAQAQASIQVKQTEESNIYKIFFTNGEVEFVPSNLSTEPRTDTPESPKLKEIKVYSYEGGVKTLLKSITFHYSYFKDRTNADGRLKLDSLRMVGIAGTIPQVYRFDYTTNSYSWKYDTGYIGGPVDVSKQDYFGYFNNKSNSHLIDISTYNGVTILDGPADRITVETYMKEGVLSKITYPEGGYTTFDLEANHYKNAGIAVLGGGLRVKTIKHFDGLGNQASMKAYKYGSDAGEGVGKLSSLWSFPSSGNVGEFQFLSGNDGLSLYKTVSIGSNGLSEMSSHDGTPVYYTSVREFNEAIATTTANGYTDYNFSFEPDVSVTTPISFIRDIEPWKRGLLLSKSVHKSDGLKLSETFNSYDSFKEESIVNLAKVRFVNQASITCSFCSSGMLNGFAPFPNNCQFPQLIYFTGQNKTGQKKISQSIERSFSGSSFVETVQNFLYDNYLQQSEMTTLSSKGETLKTTYTHPYDYLTISPYISMASYNYITPIVEETSFIDNVQAFKKSTDYSTLGGHFNPSKIRTKIGSGTEITPIVFDDYDSRGNLLKYTLRTGQTSQFTWYGITGTDKGKTDLLKNQTLGGGASGLVLGRTMSYDYFSLVGLKTMTDYNGYTTNYSFDGHQRLLNIKDAQGFLLKDFYYHYANQAALTGLGVTPTNTLNYLISRTAREAQTGTKLTSNVDSTTTEIQYVDGLSRPIQSQIWKASPDKTKDLISSTSLYDAFGRTYKGILPTPSDGILGAYKSNAEALSGAFYDNDDNPFSETIFEKSPLNRPDKLFGAGQAWRVAGNEKFTQMSYLTAGKDIYKFAIQTNGSVQWSSSYDTSSLYSNLTTSERGFKTFELKDKQGRVTHKFQQLAMPFTYAITAMVYDELNGGRLAFIIPPEAYNKFGTGSGQKQSFSEGDSLYKEAIYHYKFNAIGDLVERHIPGGGTTRFVLDKHQRVILENDSKDSTNLWKITKYDALSRPIFKGILTNLGAKTRQAIQTDIDNFQNTFGNYAYEERGTDLLGYTNRSFPTAYTPVETDVKEVVYYDDYSQIDTTGYGFKPAKAFHAQGLAVGLVTGTLIRNLETNEWYKNLNFYDYKGRNIQTHSKNHVGGIDRIETQYRFNNEILKMRMAHKKTGIADITELYEYSYDHLGRKVSFSHNGNVVAKYGYDNISRLQNKKFRPAGSALLSSKTGDWNTLNTWQSGVLPLGNDNVTINSGHTITIPSGSIASAGILNDKGIFKNFGTLNMGKFVSSDLYAQTFHWHIRGNLRGYNLDASGNLTNSLFSLKLEYEDAGFWDGNIGKQEWKSNLDNITRSFTMNYDGASRISGATYSGNGNENYSLDNLSYDLNGNLKTLNRKGKAGTNSWNYIDQLTYDYLPYSNKIKAVNDAQLVSNPNVGDFRDSSSIATQYTYNADGSLNSDDNKKITFEWNYLKSPKKITKANGQWKKFQYDASGKLLQTQTSTGKTTDYIGNLTYENNVLYQIAHDEGRIINGNYEYDINDHAGNLRLSFKDSLGIAKIVTKLDYDPWGLRLKGLDYYNSGTYNKFKTFSGKQLHDDFGFNLLSYKFRFHDPALGRFISIDPLAEKYNYNSTFAFAENKLGLGVEYEGLEMVGYSNVGDAVWRGAGFSHVPDRGENIAMAKKTAINTAKVTAEVIGTAVLGEVLGMIAAPLLEGTILGEMIGVSRETKVVSGLFKEGSELGASKGLQEVSKKEISMYAKMSDKELSSAQKSYTKLVKEHETKLAEFKADPIGKTSPEKMEQAKKGGDAAVQKVIDGRVKSLEQQIKKQEGELNKINQEIGQRQQ